MKPCLGLGLLFAVALVSASPVFGPKVAKVKYSEWMRFESRTVSDGNSSQSEEATRSKWSLSIDLPLSSEAMARFDGETGFEIKFGSSTISGKLSDDMKYHAGATSAEVPITLPRSNAIYATAKLKWGKDKVSITLTPKSDTSPSLTARDYMGERNGALNLKSKLALKIGDITQEVNLILTGKMDKKVVDTEVISGAVIVIDLKGEGQAEVGS
ncbi:MAG: hypothetical protein BGO01_00585 [Armatimonadetes bacterium 55-13]|nr:hypothetical protein [Armatimonadota bacterium]OJU62096.1 MAG: hypothetical protein BGO01_00585 [Armatimonadetes bacterium 55-13]